LEYSATRYTCTAPNMSKDLLALLTPKWTLLIFTGIRVLFIAVVFEFAAWWSGRRAEKIAAPFILRDQDRAPKWRSFRRATLKHAPKLVLRLLLYTVAMILVFAAFGAPVLELSISVAAVATFVGAGFLPLLRDYAQGYVLLMEDSLAPGDLVDINGFQGQVENWTMRATWLRDASGKLHVLSHRAVIHVTVIQRAAGEEAVGPAGHDPLALPNAARAVKKK